MMNLPIEVQVHITCADGKAFYRADMLWRDLPVDRRPKTGGYTQIFSAATGETSQELCSLVWLMMPEEHFQMEYGADRLRDRELWEARARVVEETLIRKACPETVERIKRVGNLFQMDWPWAPPNVRERSLSIHPYGHSILLFQEPWGGYQCFLPESTWLAQFRDCPEAIVGQYSSAQGVEFKLVWAHHFLSHKSVGVES